MWTKKSTLLVGAAVVVAFAGLTFRSFHLMATSAMLLSHITVNIFANAKTNLSANRIPSVDKIYEGNDISIDLEIMNHGKKTGILELRDKISKQLKITSGSNYTFLNLGKGEMLRLGYTLEAPLTGIYFLGPINLRVQDIFSLFYRVVDIDIVHPLSVYPKIEDIEDVDITAKSEKLYPGSQKMNAAGLGSDFYSIREFRPGDSFKDINWKAFARKGELLVNEYHREVVCDVSIVLDAREVMTVGIEYNNPLIKCRRAGAALANFFIGRRDSVALVTYNDTVVTLKPGGSSMHLYDILTALAGAEAKGHLPLLGVIQYALPYIPPKTPIIIMSTLSGDDNLHEAISEMMTHGYFVTIISPNPIDFELNARKELKKKRRTTEEEVGDEEEEKKERDPLPYEIMRLERSILLDELRTLGARIVEWKPNESLLAVLMKAAEQP